TSLHAARVRFRRGRRLPNSNAFNETVRSPWNWNVPAGMAMNLSPLLGSTRERPASICACCAGRVTRISLLGSPGRLSLLGPLRAQRNPTDQLLLPGQSFLRYRARRSTPEVWAAYHEPPRMTFVSYFDVAS